MKCLIVQMDHFLSDILFTSADSPQLVQMLLDVAHTKWSNKGDGILSVGNRSANCQALVGGMVVFVYNRLNEA